MALRALIFVKLLLRGRCFCLNTGGFGDAAMIAAEAAAAAVASSFVATSVASAAVSLVLIAPATLEFGPEVL